VRVDNAAREASARLMRQDLLMRDRPIPVSQLAAYAADPSGFRARRGAVVSPEAADFGERYHRAFARSTPRAASSCGWPPRGRPRGGPRYPRSPAMIWAVGLAVLALLVVVALGRQALHRPSAARAGDLCRSFAWTRRAIACLAPMSAISPRRSV